MRSRFFRILIITLVFLVANVSALFVSERLISSRIERDIIMQSTNATQNFGLFMYQYEYTFQLLEEMVITKIADTPKTGDILAYLKAEDSRLAAIIGVDFDGIYLYYQGQYLYSWDTDYAVYEESGYDARTRPWYIGAIEAKGKISFTPPYYSYANGYMLSTISRVQPDGKTVFAYDIKLDSIQRLSDKLSPYAGALSMMCSKEQMVLCCTEPLYLGASLSADDDALAVTAAQIESDLEADPESGDDKAYQKMASAVSFSRFHAEYGPFLDQLLQTPDMLLFNSHSLCWGYACQNSDYIYYTIVPLSQMIWNMADIWLILLLLVNAMIVIGSLVLHKRIKTLELQKAYQKLANSGEELDSVSAELQEAIDSEKKLKNLTHMLQDSRPLAQVFEDVLKELGSYLSADRVSIYRIDNDHAIDAYEWCSADISEHRASLRSFSSRVIDSWMPIFIDEDSVCVSDIETIRRSRPDEYALASAAGVHSYIAVPLAVADRGLYGFLCVDNPPPEKIRNISALILTLAYSVSAAIVRDRNRKQ